MSNSELIIHQRALTNGQVMAYIARQWMRRPALFVLTVVAMLIGVGCDLYMPIAAGRMMDAVAAGPASGADGAWVGWALFVVASFSYFMVRLTAMRFWWNRFAARNMADMTSEAFERLQSFSSDWHANAFAGSTVRKITRAMWGYDVVSDMVVLALGPTLLVLVGLPLYMMTRWPLVGLYALIVILGFMVMTVCLSRFYIRPRNLISNARDSAIGAALADAIGANSIVKGFGAEAREAERFAATVEAWRVAALQTWDRFINSRVLQFSVLALLQGGLTGLLIYLWAKGQAKPGDVTFAIASFMLMSGYLRQFGENVQMLQRALDDTEDVAAFMQQKPEVADAPDVVPFKPGAGEIRFDHVTFQYEHQGRALYEDFSLTIAPGERVALVGPTGSGKSTFVKLIQRLYDVQSGAVLVDGQDVRGVTQASLRQVIAVAAQDSAMFHRTIYENIAYASPSATRNEVIAAARRARAHDFIERLPRGYDTLVGERGVKLSGGERQRVSLARAFLADARILALDEATASLDVTTEAEVQAAMAELMEGRTVILIAHRLSTIRHADRILVFDGGSIVEQGSHAALIARGGAYARLHATAQDDVVYAEEEPA